jgi:hypothetical protein
MLDITVSGIVQETVRGEPAPWTTALQFIKANAA